MNIFVMLPALIIPLTMAIHQLAESAPLLSKAWTWPPYHPGSAPGTMGQALLNTERWRLKEVPRRTEEAKVRGQQTQTQAAGSVTHALSPQGCLYSASRQTSGAYTWCECGLLGSLLQLQTYLAEFPAASRSPFQFLLCSFHSTLAWPVGLTVISIPCGHLKSSRLPSQGREPIFPWVLYWTFWLEPRRTVAVTLTQSSSQSTG